MGFVYASAFPESGHLARKEGASSAMGFNWTFNYSAQRNIGFGPWVVEGYVHPHLRRA